eukprot:TRINITY_DN20461_c0_g1_i1.p1 TRINITY_DN20461_c0_g1~~TRINITY_DN20461_c0_g1_i1.p1  ORF type:complete len:116 (+),score=1.15 TRINITY_DN20461_c0_g1_i1:540-887(+)
MSSPFCLLLRGTGNSCWIFSRAQDELITFNCGGSLQWLRSRHAQLDKLPAPSLPVLSICDLLVRGACAMHVSTLNTAAAAALHERERCRAFPARHIMQRRARALWPGTSQCSAHN